MGLEFVFLLWGTTDELYRTLDIDCYIREKNIQPDAYYGPVGFSSLISTIQDLQHNISLPTFASPIP